MRKTQIARKAGFSVLLVTMVAMLGLAAPASAAPKWKIYAASNSTANPGGKLFFVVKVANAGDKALPEIAGGNGENCVPGAPPPADQSKCSTMTATFPAGITPLEGEAFEGCSVDALANSISCPLSGRPDTSRSPFAMTTEGARMMRLTTEVTAGASGKPLTSSFAVSGGGGGSDSTVHTVRVVDDPPEFGLAAFDGQMTADAAGTPFTQAAGHPYELSTQVEFNTFESPGHPFPIPGGASLWPVEEARDIVVDLPPGLLGNLNGVDRCTAEQLVEFPGPVTETGCAPGAQIGTVDVLVNAVDNIHLPGLPVFNMVPPTGAAARFGFFVLGTPVILDAIVRRDDYGVSIVTRNISQGLPVYGSDLALWGVPSASIHNSERACTGVKPPTLNENGKTCSTGSPETPLLRLPTTCTAAGEGLEWKIRSSSWKDPGSFGPNGLPDLSDSSWKSSSYRTHALPSYPVAPEEWGPQRGVEGCSSVPVKATLAARTTSIDTETASGLEVHVEVPNPGLENATGVASSDIRKVKVSLPRGVTINPSQAEGLGVCSPARYESTELSFHPTPGRGCPDDSKIGRVEVVTPLLDETLSGDVYIAQQDDPTTAQHGAENPFDSLLAIYVVIANPERGILVKLPGKVETDQATGRIVTTFDDLPQQPFSSFDFKFREGARAPLVTPPACGTYETEAEFSGWSDPGSSTRSTSAFQIVHGIGGGPCPSTGLLPFKPRFSAGSINNAAGAYSPFNLRLTRNDGEQDMTKFSSILPKGMVAKIAGVGRCSEAAIASAKGKTGRQELASPSCPADSQIGRSLAGAGVGSVLTYVPGKIYLAGPYNGAPLSVVAITPAVAGPFDVGAVVVREALSLDPVSAEVHVDGERSDPIPHILAGIPLKLRDLRVYVDRDKFTINPTSCSPAEVKATLFGSNADVFNPGDDVPVALASRYQAANCAALRFKPKLSIKLSGGTSRGGHPALRAIVTPRPGDANIGKAVVKLPRSAFLDQSHIRTICTRVQFAARACPPGAIYGRVRAFTPLLDEPLAGPVYLRSSSHKLPDLVFDLRGVVDIEVAGRIDSIGGGIRSTFEEVPDAPVSKLVLEMQGGKKGLIQNSRDLCASTNRAEAKLDGQNGEPYDFKPVVKASCSKRRRSQQK